MKEKYTMDNRVGKKIRELLGSGKDSSRSTGHPYDFTSKVTTASKSEDSKSKLRAGSLTVTNETPAYLDKPEVQSFFAKALRGIQQDDQGEKHRKTINTQIENIQTLYGEISGLWEKIAKDAQDRFEYISYPRKDLQGYNEKADERAKKENFRNRMMNEAVAWMAQQIIEDNHPFLFQEKKEFRELRELMLNPINSKDAKQNIERLQKELEKLKSGEEQKVLWQHLREKIVNQITTANQRIKESEEKDKKYEEMFKEHKEYTTAIIHDDYSQAKERYKQAKKRATQSENEYTANAEDFAKEVGSLLEEINPGEKKKPSPTPEGSSSFRGTANGTREESSAEQTNSGDGSPLPESPERRETQSEENKPGETYSSIPKNIKKDIEGIVNASKEIVGLEKGITYIAKSAAEKAKRRVQDVQKKAKDGTRDTSKDYEFDSIDKELKDWEREKNLLVQTIEKQKSLTSLLNTLNKSIKEETIVNIGKVKFSQDIDDLIEKAAKRLEILNKRLDEYNRVENHYHTVTPKAVHNIYVKKEGNEEYIMHDEIDKKGNIANNKININNIDNSEISIEGEYDAIHKISFYKEKDILCFKHEKTLNGKTTVLHVQSVENKIKDKNDKEIECTSFIININGICHENNEIMKERAKNLAEQYKNRKKKTTERIKQYEEQLRPLIGVDKKAEEGIINANPAIQHIKNALTNARRIAKLEQQIAMDYSSIANNTENSSMAINLQNVEDHLLNIRDLYQKEVKEIENARNEEIKLGESARKNQKDLQELCKLLENPTPFPNPDSIIDDANRALNNNSRYIDYKAKTNDNRIKDLFQVLDKTLMAKDIEDIQGQSIAHAVMDNVDKGCLSWNGVYMEWREFRNFGYDPETGNFYARFREDITEIFVDGEKPYTKRFAELGLNSNIGDYKIQIPGIDYNRPGKARSILIINEKTGKIHEISTKGLRKLVFKSHNKEKGDIEWTMEEHLKTMPDEQMEPDNTISPEKLHNTMRVNAGKQTCTVTDGQFTFHLDKTDLTETIVDPEVGVIFRTDKEWRNIPVKLLAIINTLMNKPKELQSEASYLSIDLKNKSLDLLKEAHRTGDQTQIAEAFALLDSTRANLATDKAGILDPLRRVPKDEYELAKLREQALNQLQRDVLYKSKSAKELLNASDNLNHSLIVDGLLTKEFQAVLKDINNDKIDKKTQQTLQTMLTEIYNKFHIFSDDNEDKKFNNHSTPELVKEYERYASRIKDLSEKEKEYLKDIENFVDSKSDVYLNNEIYLIKANSTTDLNEVFDTLGKLKTVNYIEDPESLEGRRQTYENIMVEHLEKAVKRVNDVKNRALIWSPLHEVMLLRQRRLNNLEHVKNALTAESKEGIKKNIKKLADQPSFNISKLDDKYYNKKVDNIEADLDKLINDMALKKQNPAEYQKRATELIQKTSALAYQHLLDSFAHDPEALVDLKARRVDIYLKISEQASTALNTALRLRFFEQQKGLMFTMMNWEICVESISMGAMRLGQFEARIGNVFHRLMSEIFNTGL